MNKLILLLQLGIFWGTIDLVTATWKVNTLAIGLAQEALFFSQYYVDKDSYFSKQLDKFNHQNLYYLSGLYCLYQGLRGLHKWHGASVQPSPAIKV